MYETVSVEERNKPAVGLIYQHFANDAVSASSTRGMPLVRTVQETIPSEWTVAADIEAGISAVMENIVAALTTLLTAEEKSPKPLAVEKPPRIAFKGSLEEVNQFFYRRGWTDGLPVIPPTEEAVAEMLTGTDLAPDYVIAEMVPRRGKATVEKIAINAVLAGALPTYMPLLIAGVQALVDPKSGPTGLAVSTGSFAPLWIVNGPIRSALHINHSYGVLSPGDMANATIGRALGLITKNIRGVRKGVEDMGILGNPGKYTMVVAESEENSPWEPLHVEQGFNKEDSTITLAFCQSFAQLFPYGTDDKGILSTIIYNVMPAASGMIVVMMAPPLAKAVASAGWTKRDIKAFITENARVPWYRHPGYWGSARVSADDLQPLNAQDSSSIVRPTRNISDPIQVFVAGGLGSRVGLFSGSTRPSVTKKVALPANWDKLVQKYKGLVPTYQKY